ncbi:MAG: hypothetical protein QNJ36_21035 [Calothrix sp. MO_167.B42]|nr:hypothetical protein [Calothrix sp. MO_167.B42]
MAQGNCGKLRSQACQGAIANYYHRKREHGNPGFHNLGEKATQSQKIAP